MINTYAKIENNVVTNKIIAEDAFISSLDEIYIKVTTLTKNAEIGYSWDSENLKFIASKPYPSWSLNAEFNWESPEGPMPTEGHPIWDEESLTWEQQTPGELHPE
jgi:hypothetical protein